MSDPGLIDEMLSSASMTRRHILSLAALALVGGCRSKTPTTPAPVLQPESPPREPLEGSALVPVEVDPTRAIRTIVGLRPFRPSGFVVRREEAEGKVLIHHYGHGGGGMSLSWGTAHQAVRLASSVSGRKCVVVGGGVIGLSTARLLQRYGAHVTVIAKALPPETTSNVSGAQWWPFSVFDAGRRTEDFGGRFVEAARLSFLEFQQLVGPRWGVRWLPNYYLSESPHSSGWMSGPTGALHDLQIGYRDFGPGEHVFPLPYVRRFFTMMIEPATYLATLLSEVQAGGADIVVQEILSRDELLRLPYDVIFNCTGLGAGPFTADTELVPVKGQLSILMPQPGIDYNLIHEDYYMFSRTDGIVLGGTYVRGQADLAPDLAARDRIISAHHKLFTQFRSHQQGALR